MDTSTFWNRLCPCKDFSATDAIENERIAAVRAQAAAESNAINDAIMARRAAAAAEQARQEEERRAQEAAEAARVAEARRQAEAACSGLVWDGDCVSSPGYPNHYGNYEDCDIEVRPALTL